ncbi:16S rRNA (uracil(1498)-N(3))-methyltransferase [Streptomyces sp. NPDC006743]|uniref:16S rRNA (uracil(1498)-N(3))-methyltransferase n=1 Tax=Streptomyces sp. NPDC006743 TaxID=3154480 RepID=UPI003451FA08
MTAPVFVADRLEAGPAPFVLDGAEGRHAVSVKRLQPGERVVLTDGAGRWAGGEVSATEGKDRLVVRLDPVTEEPPPSPRITVVQALPKGDRGELAVETMTEVGVDAIVPWAASRCITQWKGERGLKALGKWRATAREAGKQSRRVRFPEVADAATTKQVAALLAGADFAAVLHESGRERLATAELPALGEIVLVVGPEGGVSPEELALFAEAGAGPYVLGPTVLRTSTAGTAAAALLLGRTGRWS